MQSFELCITVSQIRNLFYISVSIFKFQLSLIRAGWNELLIAAFSFKSTHLNEDGIRLSDGTVIAKDEAHMAGKIDKNHFYIVGTIVIALID